MEAPFGLYIAGGASGIGPALGFGLGAAAIRGSDMLSSGACQGAVSLTRLL